MGNRSFKTWSLTLGLLFASSCLAAAALSTGKENPERVALEQRTAAGDKGAQMLLNTAAISGKLGFTDETGRAYLEQRVAAGDLDAQERLKEVVGDGKLKCSYLKLRAAERSKKGFINKKAVAGVVCGRDFGLVNHLISATQISHPNLWRMAPLPITL